MSTHVDLYADKGSTFSVAVSIKNKDGSAYDCSSYSVRGQVRKNYKSEYGVNLSCDFLNQVNGEISISLDSTDTRDMKAGRYYYDVELFTAIDGTVTRVLEGQFEVSERVTNESSNISLGDSESVTIEHANRTDNPHNVGADQIGLGSVDNTTDLDKPISNSTQASLDLKSDKSNTYTKTEVDTKVADLVDSAPETLDTLNELASALGDDPNFATTVTNLVGNNTNLVTVHIDDKENPHEVSLSKLTDVDFTVSPSDGQGILWDSVSGKWLASDIDSGPVGGAVDSVNTQTGVVVLNADDIDDSTTAHKFATQAQLLNADSALQNGDNITELNNNAGYITSAPVDSVNTQTGSVVLNADDIDDSTTAHKFATQAQLLNADSALQNGDNITELTNNAGYITSVPVDSVNTQTGVVVLDADDIDDAITTHKFATQTQLNKADSALQNGDNITELTNNAGYIISTDPTLDSVTTNGSTTLNDISVGRIATLDPSNSANNNIAIGNSSASVGGSANQAIGNRSATFGGRSNKASGAHASSLGGINQTLIGNESEGLGSSNLFLYSKYTTAVGTANSTIGTLDGDVPVPENNYATDSVAKHSIILGGENIEIQQAQYSATVGGDGNTIETNHHRSVIIGGTGITTDSSDTVYVPTLNVGAGFKMPTGATDSYVLTSDDNGVGTWQLSSESTLVSDVTSDVDVGSISKLDVVSAGTTLQQFAEQLLLKTYFPTYTNPSVNLTDNISSNVEAGTQGLTLTANFNAGSINGSSSGGIWDPNLKQDDRSGPASSYTFDGDQITLTQQATNTLALPSLTISDGQNSFSVLVDYSEGPQPVDSVGSDYQSPLSAGSVSKSMSVYGRRNAFYGTNLSGVTSSGVRALSNTNLNPSNGTSFVINISSGSTDVAFAYPATLRDVNAVIHAEGLGADVKGVFTQSIIDVAGANSYNPISYKVYTYTPDSGPWQANATYTVTI